MKSEQFDFYDSKPFVSNQEKFKEKGKEKLLLNLGFFTL